MSYPSPHEESENRRAWAVFAGAMIFLAGVLALLLSEGAK